MLEVSYIESFDVQAELANTTGEAQDHGASCLLETGLGVQEKKEGGRESNVKQ